MLRKGEKVLVSAEGAGSNDVIPGVISYLDSCSIHIATERSLVPLPGILKKPVNCHHIIVKSGDDAVEIEAFFREVKKPNTMVFQASGAMNMRQARRHVRYHIHLPFDYQLSDGDGMRPVVNMPVSELILSESGVGFYSEECCRRGERITIWIYIPDDATPLELCGTVVYSRMLKFGCRVGVKFAEMENEMRARLDAHIRKIAAAPSALVDDSLEAMAYK
ncbi:MAG: hypothetical protein Kow0090_01810 [Myxococcota bacterium]